MTDFLVAIYLLGVGLFFPALFVLLGIYMYRDERKLAPIPFFAFLSISLIPSVFVYFGEALFSYKFGIKLFDMLHIEFSIYFIMLGTIALITRLVIWRSRDTFGNGKFAIFFLLPIANIAFFFFPSKPYEQFRAFNVPSFFIGKTGIALGVLAWIAIVLFIQYVISQYDPSVSGWSYYLR